MSGRTASFRGLATGLVIAAFLGTARIAPAGDGADTAASGGTRSSGNEVDRAGSAATPAPEGTDARNLARLAELERLRGNGGPEDEKSGSFAGYDRKEGGVVFKDASEDNLLKIKGYLQIRYTFKSRYKQGDTVDAGEVGTRNDSFVELERARITFEGNVLTHNLTYKFQVDGDTDGSGAVRLLDGYAEYWAGEALGASDPSLLGLGAGQTKTHFGRQEPTSGAYLQMVDRSLTNEFFNLDRQLGLWLRGDAGLVYYSFALTNGFDSGSVAPSAIDNIPAAVGKIDFNLWGNCPKKGKYEEGNVRKEDMFAVGVSAATDANNSSSSLTSAKYKVYQAGADAQLKSGLFSAQSEVFVRWLDYHQGNGAIPGGDGSTQKAYGFYGQAGLLLGDSDLELTGLASFVWCDGVQHGNGVEAGPGINWYISGNHKIKWQTNLLYIDVSRNVQDSTEDLDGSGGSTGAALSPGSTASSFSSTASQLQAGEKGFMILTQLQLSF